MSEAGQPGAATPGDQGDGTGQQDDPGRTGGGWAPPAAGWPHPGDGPAARAAAARWQSDPAVGWAASSPRHGDLPAPLNGRSGEPQPPARVNGHHTNGVSHPTEQPVGRLAPVSAPPIDDRRELGGDRLIVPAQRPAPAVEQPLGLADPESGPARHSSDEPPAHPPHWAEPRPPTSAPPAMQVPPVGTAASGFEVPPGFHAPAAEWTAVEEPAAEPRGWGAAHPPAAEPRAAQPRAAAEPPASGEPPANEPDWSGPSWNRPSWGGGWAPPWSRTTDEPSGRRGHDEPARRRAHDDEPATRRAHDDEPSGQRRAEDEPAGHRGRSDEEPGGPQTRETEEPAGHRAGEGGRPSWAAEPHRAYEPVRAEPSHPYEPVRTDPGRPYEVTRSESGPTFAAEAERRVPGDRPAWAGGSPSAAPSSGPPDPSGPPPATVERPTWAGERPTVEPPAWAGERPTVEPPAWAGERATAEPPVSPERASWGPGPAPTSAAPVSPAAARPSSAPPVPSSAPPAAPDRPAWAGGPGGVWSAPPDRPSWAARPASVPPAMSGPGDDGPDVAQFRAAGFRSRSTESTDPSRPEVTGHHADPTVSGHHADPAAVGHHADSGHHPDAAAAGHRAVNSAAGRPAATAGQHAPAPAAGPRAAASGRPGEAGPTGPTASSATSGGGHGDRTLSAPAPTSAPPYAARRSAPDPAASANPADDRRPDPTAAVLPQRVPAEPDVPVVPEPPAVEPHAETPELARIATHLRRDDEPAPPQERPEGFDVNAILGAVREVAGVRDASLRRTAAGAHSLRLDLADGADAAEVSRHVARLLQERMGLAAAPQNVPGVPATPPPPVRRRGAEPSAPRAAEGRAEFGSRAPEGRETGARTAEGRAERRTADRGPVDGAGSAAGRPDPRAEGRVPRAETETPRRRRQNAAPRGRATVEETSAGAGAPAGVATGSPATTGASYSGAQLTTTESAPSRPLDTGGAPGPRVVIDHVLVSTFGLDATVEVRLIAGDRNASGYATGPAVDGYVLRLCAVAAAAAVDELLRRPDNAEGGRCFVEHAAVVPFGNCEVATVVVLLVCDGWVEQLAGSALVAGDPRQAVVRATLAAVNRRLEALLA
ncbi:hypothetical protein [Micromonospora krabiensis]|uniref:Uncharacterized protein n=1 Tax=Micromonospora krabiensis TaxID=307121 RepID=A0A1C3NA90_9ACTN|nr:hypothetical protein [Micromonospora krabiensis]SBV29479.1 hypothetical protein GA0070620_5051 [Micromonospora krabiensis]